MNIIDVNVSRPVPALGESTTRNVSSARQRVTNFMGHAIEMLNQLKVQNQTVKTKRGNPLLEDKKLNNIYKTAEHKIYILNAEIQNSIAKPTSERSKKISDLKRKIAIAQQYLNAHQKEVNRLSQRTGLHTTDRTKQAARKLKAELGQAQKKLTNSTNHVTALQKQLDDAVSNLSKNEVENLTQQLKHAEKEIVKIIRETQIDVVSEIAERKYPLVAASQAIANDFGVVTITPEDQTDVKEKVSTLARGGWGATWIYFLSFISVTNAIAIIAFEESQLAMQKASELKPAKAEAHSKESQIENDKRSEIKKYRKQGILTRRAGVIGLNGIYRFQVAFSEKQIHKQFKSFIAQNSSRRERTTIERKIKIKDNSFTSKIIPLNREFDLYMALSGILTGVFTSIFGTRGISSANRQEPHLINSWETNLVQNGKTIFRSLRHAILSDKYENDQAVRAENSKKAAIELLKAALLEELKTQGLTIEQAKAKGITLNLNSVSLVTPDDFRAYIPGQADEKKMLLDQVSALTSFNGQNVIELDGVKIPVKVKANAFNFGVNKHLKRGLENQYAHNLKAMKGFRKHVKKFNAEIENERALITKKLHKITKDTTVEELSKLAARRSILEKEQEKANLLMQDIELLMADKDAYIKGDNQYEIGAKILNLNSLMDQTIEDINKTRKLEDRISGFKSAFNCMSGKDRTGWMDAVAKTLAIMAAANEGYYPSHAEFMEDARRRKEFAQILEKVLLEAGNLEITEYNTGARGYKVKDEAILFGMSAEVFLHAQGLSSTTGD